MQDAPDSARPVAAPRPERAGTSAGAPAEPAGRLPRQRPAAQLPALQARRRGGRADALADRGRGVPGPADRPARSLRSQVAEPARRQHAAGVGEGRRARSFLLGTDDQGRDILSTILYGTRSSLLIGICSVLLAGRPRPVARAVGRLRGRPHRRRDHAHRRRAAHLSGHPHRPADRRRGAGDLQEPHASRAASSGSWCSPSASPSGCNMPAPCAA